MRTSNEERTTTLRRVASVSLLELERARGGAAG